MRLHMNEDFLISICCSAPPVVAKTDIFKSSIPAGDIDFDSMDGDPVVIARSGLG